MGEIFLRGGWDRRTGWDRGGMEGPMVLGNGSGAPALPFEVRQVSGSGVYHHFHWCCRGSGVFVSVQKNNPHTLYTNQNCKVVQDSTKISHDIIIL